MKIFAIITLAVSLTVAAPVHTAPAVTPVLSGSASAGITSN